MESYNNNNETGVITNFDTVSKSPFKKYAELLKYNQLILNSLEAQQQLVSKHLSQRIFKNSTFRKIQKGD
jgi:hypothetical protein